MGLSNKYIGTTKKIEADPQIFSADWCHREANKRRTALAEEEAAEISEILKRQHKDDIENLSPDDAKLSFELEIEENVFGRELEDDEIEFLENNPGQIVIDGDD